LADYLSLFIGGATQPATLAAAALVWLGLSALGRVVLADDESPFAFMVGWAILVLALTVPGVLIAGPFRPVMTALAVIAAAAVWALRHRGRPPWTAGAWRAWVLAAPLLLLAAAMQASQWDDFSHWLPSTAWVLEIGRFPDASMPETAATFPGYPYAWPILMALVSHATGNLLEAAGPVLNVLLLLAFATALAGLVRWVAAGEPDAGPFAEPPGWIATAIGVVAVTLANPTFVQKVILTGYADLATSATVGFAVLAAWRMLEAEAAGGARAAQRLALIAGAVLMVLVNLKQATLALYGLIIIATAIAGLVRSGIPLWRLARHLVVMAVPGLALYLLWRWHVSSELAGREFAIRPLAEWYLDLLPLVVGMMLKVLAKKGLYLGLMVVATGIGVLALFRPTGAFGRLALITGAVFLGYNAFLLFSYIAVFGEGDARRVASLWRYNQHLGLMGQAFAVYGLTLLWRRWRLAEKPGTVRLRTLPILLVLALPLVFAKKLRFDLAQPVPHYRAVAAEVAARLPDDARLVVLDPSGSGESGIITKYAMGRTPRLIAFLSAFQGGGAARIRKFLAETKPTHVLLHSINDGVRQSLTFETGDSRSWLLKADGEGWAVDRRWPLLSPGRSP